jgi:acetate kinase
VQSVSAILTINGGSSSLKFALFTPESDTLRRAVEGKFERIGLPNPILRIGSTTRTLKVTTHAECVPLLLNELKQLQVSAIGHRVVHGGPNYRSHQHVTAAMLSDLDHFSPFDPEHLPAEIALMRSFAEHFPDASQFACFDTAFHRDLPRVAYLLPIPRKYEQQGIRRYGFHGLSCSWLMQELERIAGRQTANGRIVIAHLGNGASMTAVHHGRSIDTTMSFTPTAGLVMSRRTGDLDPSLAAYLARTENMTAERFQHLVNAESGLLGISEISSDLRDLLAVEKTDSRAADAISSFCYNAKKHLAALAATMGGVDTLIFSAGIGENNPAIRARICEGLEFFGIQIDPVANERNSAIVSTGESKVIVRVMNTDEEMFIAQTVSALLHNEAKP